MKQLQRPSGRCRHFLFVVVVVFICCYCWNVVRVASKHVDDDQRVDTGGHVQRISSLVDHPNEDFMTATAINQQEADDVIDCPCSKIEYCKPLTGIPPVHPNGELYGFYGNNDYFVPSTDLNFTYLTTIAWAFNNTDVTCVAHEHGVRVIQGSPPINLHSMVANETAIQEWIDNVVLLLQVTFRDGIVFDYEEPLTENSIEGITYAHLINQTRYRLQSINPSYQITTCIPWSPDSIDGRSYPWPALAAASDLLYVMVYDVQSQIYNSACVAGANSPYGAMVQGVSRYLEIGINPQQLILGIPWYGYKYPCISDRMTINDRFCFLNYKPFRNVKCSDAIGKEYDYSVLMEQFRSNDNDMLITSDMQWDDNMESPYFNMIDLETYEFSQVWFDNPQSLRIKYQWAKQQNLGGIGPFTINNVNVHESAMDAIEMWSSFDAYFIMDNNDSAEKDSMNHSTIVITT